MLRFLEWFIEHYAKVFVLEVIGVAALALVLGFSAWVDFPASESEVASPAGASTHRSARGAVRAAHASQNTNGERVVCTGTSYAACLCDDGGCRLAPESSWRARPKSVLLEKPSLVSLRVADARGGTHTASSRGVEGPKVVFPPAELDLSFRAQDFKAGIEIELSLDGRKKTNCTVRQPANIIPGDVFQDGVKLRCADASSPMKYVVFSIAPDSTNPSTTTNVGDAAATLAPGVEARAASTSKEESGPSAHTDDVVLQDLTPSLWPGGMCFSPALGRIMIFYFVVVLFLGMWVASTDIDAASGNLLASVRGVFGVIGSLLFHATLVPLASGGLISLLVTALLFASTSRGYALRLSFIWFCLFVLLTALAATLFVTDRKTAKGKAPKDTWGRVGRNGATAFAWLGNLLTIKEVAQLLLNGSP